LGKTIKDASWDDINGVRDRMMARTAATVSAAAQSFVEDLVQTFPTVVLARLFVVVPFASLPAAEQPRATAVAAGHPKLAAATRVLSLLGTAGAEPAWCDRARSVGHLAIPLLDQKFVQNIPMVAKLLADLDVDLAALDDGRPLVTRALLGGINRTFFVPDARETRDGAARHVIASQEFVERHGIRSVFGMGGAYVAGALAIVIAFTSELLDSVAVGRFPSLVGNFKMATSAQFDAGRIYRAS
jgi:hypothetical protein